VELVTSNLSIERGGQVLLRNLDLELRPGRICVLLGRNGSGKSTLLLTLAGVLPHGSGTIQVGGRALESWSGAERGRHIAWQGALPSAEFGFTVQERLELVRNRSRPVIEAVDRLELAPLAERRLFELSAGERQRVELAALWLRDAPIWLTDEPTSHLDLAHQVACLDLLRSEANAGRSIIVVLHDLTQAHAIADDALLLLPGGRARSGTGAELLRPTELEPVYGTTVHEMQGPDGVLLVPAYHAEYGAGSRK